MPGFKFDLKRGATGLLAEGPYKLKIVKVEEGDGEKGPYYRLHLQEFKTKKKFSHILSSSEGAREMVEKFFDAANFPGSGQAGPREMLNKIVYAVVGESTYKSKKTKELVTQNAVSYWINEARYEAMLEEQAAEAAGEIEELEDDSDIEDFVTGQLFDGGEDGDGEEVEAGAGQLKDGIPFR